MPYDDMGGGSPSLASYAPTTTALLIAVSRQVAPFRTSLLVQNQGAADVYLGPATVAASGANRGILLKGGQTPPATFSDSTIAGALYAITLAGTADLTVMEVL